MNKRFLIYLALCLMCIPAFADKNDRGVASIGTESPTFMARGKWTAGGHFSWSMHNNDNYKLAIIEGIDSHGYNVSVVPCVTYAFARNFAVGVNMGYSRNFLNLENAGMEVAGTTISVTDYYYLKHSVTTEVFGRAYLPLGRSGRFALFADVGFKYEWGQGKVTDRQVNKVVGTYQKDWTVSLGVNPGMSTFITDHLMLDACLGIAGIRYSSVNQIHNQVDTGTRDSTGFSYMLNPLSLCVGLHYCF